MPKAVLSILLLCIVTLGSNTVAQASSEDDTPVLTPEAFYQKFNMRTIYSSLGQSLKYYCESYPADFFQIDHESKDRLVITIEKDIFWYIEFLDGNVIRINDSIVSGTYNAISEYEIKYNEDLDDWEASETRIEVALDCQPFNKFIPFGE